MTPDLDKIIVAVYEKTRSTIAKDDPILLNAVVVQCLLDEQLRIIEQLSDRAIGANLQKFDDQGKNHLFTLKKLNQEHAQNIEKFLVAFTSALDTLKQTEKTDIQHVSLAITKAKKEMLSAVWIATAAIAGCVILLRFL